MKEVRNPPNKAIPYGIKDDGNHSSNSFLFCHAAQSQITNATAGIPNTFRLLLQTKNASQSQATLLNLA